MLTIFEHEGTSLEATIAMVSSLLHLVLILVAHEADIAAYADRIVTMRDGKIVADEKVAQPAAGGTIAEVARSAIIQPAEPAVRRFRPPDSSPSR